MPRLRYRKDWSYDEDLHVEQDTTESSDTSDAETTKDSGGPNDDPVSGQSWLSNRAIIASFTDAKLRSAVEYHRTMSRLLGEELRIRSLTGRTAVPIAQHGMFDYRREAGDTRRQRHRQSATRRLSTTQLQQALKALEMLAKLKEQK